MDRTITDPVEKIAATVLYEGYMLWPYRRSSRKNQRRWTFGGVYPQAYSEASGGDDPWLMQTQCLVTGANPSVEVKVRFLHIVERKVGRTGADGELEFVDELRVGGERYLAWDEAVEREIVVESLELAKLDAPRKVAIHVATGSEEETLTSSAGSPVGMLVRSSEALEGSIEVGVETVGAGVFKLTVKIANTAPWSGEDRESTLRRTFVSTHTILHAEAGEFVSLMDPPGKLARAAGECENIKTWPVLVGEDGEKGRMLSSPIILYDYPKIAPESPGDLFDGTEIDQMLRLNILTMTDDEKEEMRATDPRSREILERTEALSQDELLSLHGAIREFRVLRAEPEADVHATRDLPPLEMHSFAIPELSDMDMDPFAILESSPPESVTIHDVEVGKGSRVRLHPRRGGDIMDIALAGKAAIIEAIEQDYEGRIHLSVTIEDDPGRDLGVERVLGHRFFFDPEEVEPLDVEA